MSLETLSIPVGAGFWPQAASAVCAFARRQSLDPLRLHSMTWIVPAWAHASLARSALFESLGHRAFIPPRIAPLASWLGVALRAGTASRAELFTALRANAWVQASFGRQPSALWALAQGILQLCDELSLAAVDDETALGQRIDAALARHYRRHAARALQPQSQLVLQLWRARRTADDGAAHAIGELKTRASNATKPLVYLDDSMPDCTQGWLQAFLARYAATAPVLRICGDTRAAVVQRPLLAAAWPELVGDHPELAIAARADAAAVAAAADPLPLTIVGADSLEDEAGAVAQQVLRWLDDGVASVALVALDRLTARRVRALLERAQVLVRDETGWKLSTTSAAATVMRWLEVVEGDCYWRDLLDWLKSPFVLADRSDKAAVTSAIERAIRATGALQGAQTMRGALASLHGHEPAEVLRAAATVLSRIDRQVQSMRAAGPRLAAWSDALAQSLAALGMHAGLAGDPVGRSVLGELDAIAAALVGVDARASLHEFRALLAARFEECAHVDDAVDSPVVMLSLAATALRRFDAALLIGADAAHLPTVTAETLFMSNAVRSELGLATADQALRTQAQQLAALIAVTPRVVATWRTRERDEPNTLSPLLGRLAFVGRRAGCDLMRSFAVEARVAVVAQPVQQPAPSAAALLPLRISASQAQSLVDCPYQFYARRLLRLDQIDDVAEVPDKRDFGEAMHAVLQRFHAHWRAAAFEEIAIDTLSASLAAFAAEVFTPLVARAPAALAFERRFAGLIPRYLDWLQEHSAQGWRWSAAEQSHTRSLPLRDGRTVELRGRIDRIDVDADGRLNVLDYKARAADVLKRGLKSRGEDVQLPLYGALLAHQARHAAYLSFDRAKEKERGVALVAAPGDFQQLSGEVESRLVQDLQRIADGAPLPAIGSEIVCARCEMRGLCRRDYWEHDDAVAVAPIAEEAG